MSFHVIQNVLPRIAIAATLACVLAADVALGQQYKTLSTGSSVPWNTTLWTNGGVPPQTSTEVGLFNGGGTVTISDTSTSTTPGGMLVGWSGGATDSFTVAVTSGTLTVGSTAGDGSGSFGLTLGETPGRTGTLTQTGGVVIAPLVQARNGTGVYNLNSGTLQTQQVLNRAGILTFNFGGGTLQATGTSSTGLTGSTATMVVGAGGGTINNGGFATFMNAPISGSGNLTLAGSGTTTYTVNNTHSGTTTLSAGTLRIGNSGTTGNLAGPLVNNGVAIFDRSNDVTYTGAISGSGTLRFVGSATTITVNSLITGSGALVRDASTNAGSSFLVLNGSNTYSGGTTINAGFVQLGANNALGTGPLVFTATTDRGSLNLQGFNQTVAGLTASNTTQFRGDIYNNNGNALSTLTIDTPTGQTFTFANQIGAVSNFANIAVVKTGAGTQILTGSNLYFGTTTISSGTLQIGAGGTTGQITGDVTANGALVFDRSDDITFAGSISGSGAVTKRNANTLTLSASNIPFTGTFTMASGSLVFDRSGDIAFAGSISGSTGTVTKPNANTLSLSGSSIPFTGPFTVASGSLRFTGAANTVTVNSLITGSGALVRDASSNASGSFLVLNGSNNYSGGTTINAGFVQLGANNALGTGPLVFTATTDRGSLNLQGFNQTVAGLTASNTTQFRGDIYNNGLNTLSTLTIDTPTGQTFTFANQIGSLSNFANIALVKSGAGTQILTGNNLYTGATTISGGTLQIGAGGTTGQITGNVTANGTLVFDRSDDITFAGSISGSGAVTKRNANTLTLSGSVPLSGSFTVASGSLRFVGSATTVTVNSLITGSGALVRDASANAGGSSLVLNGSNNYSGGTTINAGFVQLGANNALGTGPLVFTATTDRGSLNLQGFNQTVAGLTASNTTQFRGDIYNQGTLPLSTLTIDTPTGQTFTYANQIGSLSNFANIAVVKTGAGTQILSGNSLYSGATAVNAGKLLVNGDNSLATGAVTVAAGAVLGGSGTIGGATTVSGTLSPGSSPGVLTIASLVLDGPSTSLFEIDGTGRGTGYDGVTITQSGGLTYGGALSLVFSGTFATNTTFDLFNFSGTPLGSFSSVTASGPYGSLTFTNSGSGVWTSGSTNVAGQTMTFSQSTGDLVIVPEPGALALAGLGIAAAAWARRRRK